MVYRTDKHRRIVESLRVMLAIIAGLLMLDERQQGRMALSVAVIAFSIYAIILLWQAAKGSLNAQRRVYYWLDSCWFLLLLYLADNEGTHYFLFLLFPVFFAAWRADYRESVAIAAFNGSGSLAVFILNDPRLPWSQLLALPLSLFVIAQVLVALARIEEATSKKQELARSFEMMAEARHSFDAIISDLILQIANKMDASVVLLAIKTFPSATASCAGRQSTRFSSCPKAPPRPSSNSCWSCRAKSPSAGRAISHAGDREDTLRSVPQECRPIQSRSVAKRCWSSPGWLAENV